MSLSSSEVAVIHSSKGEKFSKFVRVDVIDPFIVVSLVEISWLSNDDFVEFEILHVVTFWVDLPVLLRVPTIPIIDPKKTRV